MHNHPLDTEEFKVSKLPITKLTEFPGEQMASTNSFSSSYNGMSSTSTPTSDTTALALHGKLNQLCIHFSSLGDCYSDLAAQYFAIPVSIRNSDVVLSSIRSMCATNFEDVSISSQPSRIAVLFSTIEDTLNVAEESLCEGRVVAVEVELRNLGTLLKEVKEILGLLWWGVRVYQKVQAMWDECC